MLQNREKTARNIYEIFLNMVDEYLKRNYNNKVKFILNFLNIRICIIKKNMIQKLR